MKVNDPNASGHSAGQVGGSGLERVRQAELERSGGQYRDSSLSKSDDRVDLSQLGAALQTLGTDSPERVAWMEKLSAQVASGRYQPNVESITRGLIEDALSQDDE